MSWVENLNYIVENKKIICHTLSLVICKSRPCIVKLQWISLEPLAGLTKKLITYSVKW